MFRFPIPRPRSSDGTILPALLAILLAGMAALQLLLVSSDDPVLDSGAIVAGHGTSAIAPITSVAAAPIIRERPIFAPSRLASSDGTGGNPLAGAQVSGAWAVGQKMNLVLREPDGTSRTIRVGQAINDWVLASVDAGGARFSSGGKTLRIPFGSAALPGAAAQPGQKEEQGR